MKFPQRGILVLVALLISACGTGGPGGGSTEAPSFTSRDPGNSAFGSRATGNAFVGSQSGRTAFTSPDPGNGAFRSRATGNVFTANQGTGAGDTPADGSDVCATICTACSTELGAPSVSECASTCRSALRELGACEAQFGAFWLCVVDAGGECDPSALESGTAVSACDAEARAFVQCVTQEQGIDTDSDIDTDI